MRKLVLGIGNTILSDDGAGPRVVEEAGKRWLGTGTDFKTTFQAGMTLIDLITGYDRLIVVDAIQTGGTPGEIHRLSPEDFELTDNYTASEHKVGILQALRLAESLNIPAPSAVSLLAIEAKDVTSFGEELSPEVAAAVPKAVNMVIAELLGTGPRAKAGTDSHSH